MVYGVWYMMMMMVVTMNMIIITIMIMLMISVMIMIMMMIMIMFRTVFAQGNGFSRAPAALGGRAILCLGAVSWQPSGSPGGWARRSPFARLSRLSPCYGIRAMVLHVFVDEKERGRITAAR